MTTVTRHFATVGPPGAQRQIHYRRAGQGPPVLLLHQSPLSSAEMLPLLYRLAPTHTVIAPDTPGFGYSDPVVEADVTMAGLAHNLAALLDQLGIPAAAVYGFHTGASIATAFARHHPQRCVAAVAEGLLCLNDAERSEFLKHYLPPFVPAWDGGHLAWLWSRLNDQTLFFPWYSRTGAARMTRDAAPTAMLADNALDLLRAGDHYRNGYRAAIAYDPAADLRAITAPYCLMCRTQDPLHAHLQRLPPLSGNLRMEVHDDAAGLEASLLDLLHQTAQRPMAPAVVPPAPLTERPWFDFVTVRGRQLRILRAGDAQAPLAVVLHGAQGSLRSCVELATGLARHRAVLALELPGHGATDALALSELSIEALATMFNDALDALHVEACELIGLEAGAAIQVEMQRQRPRAHHLTLINAVDLSGDAALKAALHDSYQLIEHDAWGGYLLRAWHQARNHLLFFPWFERGRQYGVSDTPLLDSEGLNQQTIDLLTSGASGVALRRAELLYPLRTRLQNLGNVRLAATSWHPRAGHVRQLAGAGRIRWLPREWQSAGTVIAPPAASLAMQDRANA